VGWSKNPHCTEAKKMGRCVIEQKTGEYVWKYVFAEQASEQAGIAGAVGVGKVVFQDNSDVLVLKQEDRKRLEDYLNEEIPFKIGCGEYKTIGGHTKPITRNRLIVLWKCLNKALFKSGGIPLGSVEEGVRHKLLADVMPEIHFWQMIKAYAHFMKQHPNQKEFRFEGEY
jgi:hypothetical protein